MSTIRVSLLASRRECSSGMQRLASELVSRGACTTGAAGAAAPLALVVRGRTGAEKCPLLQYKSYYTSKEQV